MLRQATHVLVIEGPISSLLSEDECVNSAHAKVVQLLAFYRDSAQMT